jgi:lipid-A-disaccharide synthase
LNSVNNPTNNTSVLIVAAEESSALYAQRILENWKKQGLNIRAYGVGNSEMAKLGFERIADSTEMAVMGLVEIWRHWDKIKTTYKKILERAKKEKPAFALLLDYPGFNLRIAKDLHDQGIKVIYYISPQLWAWKQGRVKKVKKFCDRMMVLFPFEKDFYEKHEYKADYVGHPILDELHPNLTNPDWQKDQRQRFGVQKEDFLVGVMPGSRLGELKYCLPTQLETLEILHKNHPHLKFALLLAPNLKREQLNLPNLGFNLQIIQKEPFEMISYCDAVLCTSGTATLMVGLIEKPMVIMYKANPLTAWIGRKVVRIKYFGLVNLISQREISPELLQDDANPNKMATLIADLLFNKSKREETISDLRAMKKLLGGGGATQKVLSILKEYLP